MDGSFNYIEGLGQRLSNEDGICVHCGLDKDQHHYGVDGPRSGFVYQSRRLYCPGKMEQYQPKEAE